ELAAVLHRPRLGDGDLHVVDMIAIPDRLEYAVGKAQHHDVLHGLFAEIMIDAEDLIFAEAAEQLLVERAGRLQIEAERFFHDEPAPGTLRRRGEARVAEMACHGPE